MYPGLKSVSGNLPSGISFSGPPALHINGITNEDTGLNMGNGLYLSTSNPAPRTGYAESASTTAPTAPAPDPYEKYGGLSAFNNLISGFDTQKQNIYGTSREAAQNAAVGRKSGITDFVDTLKVGQRNLDERGVQNELAKRQGTSGVMDMVSRGIRSGGVMLSNRNAANSSAAEALARAYSELGRRQLGTVGNQYELENRGIGLAQEDLGRQTGTGVRKFDENKTQTINGIVLDARNKLAALDAAMAEADVPTRLELEQEREAIKQEALTILSQYDQELTSGVAGVQPTSTEDRRRTAFDLSNRGIAATNPFDFTSAVPTQLQNTGPFASELPLFTMPRRQEA